jgi:hypothetical protein
MFKENDMDRRGGFSPAQLEELAKLLDERMDEIAIRAATKAVEQMADEAYRMVGKTVVDKSLVVIGIIVMGLAAWGIKNGWIK